MYTLKKIQNSSIAFICLMSIVWVVTESGCQRSENPIQERELTELESKLNVVLQKTITRCDDPKNKELLKTAKLFQNLEDLPMEVVGFSVPINSGTNRVFISFTLEYFQTTPPDVLATQGLEDFAMAKENGQN